MNTKAPIKIVKGAKTYDLHLMWDLHHKCNFHCSYCSPGLNNGSVDLLRIDDLKGLIDRVVSHYKGVLGYKNILFSFTGGEPTLWKDFQELIVYAHEKGIHLGLTTNGSVGLNFWKRTSTFFDYICLSYHAEFVDNDRFLSTFEYLHNQTETVVPSVRMMMHKERKYWDKAIEILEKIKKFPNWTYECVYILDDYAKMSVHKTPYPSKEQEDFLKDNAFKSQFTDNSYVHLPSVLFDYQVEYAEGGIGKLDENVLINNNQVDFFGWQCNIGLESLFIDAEGSVYRSGCAPGKFTKTLGNIFDYKNIEFPVRPIFCSTKEGCYCPTDIRIGKQKLF